MPLWRTSRGKMSPTAFSWQGELAAVFAIGAVEVGET
jgi:hypothetical protein